MISLVAEFPQVSIQQTSAKTRKLKVKWTVTAAQDLANIGNPDVQLQAAMANMQENPDFEKIDFGQIVNALEEAFPSGRAKCEDIENILYKYGHIGDFALGDSKNIYRLLIDVGYIVEEKYEWGNCPI